MKRMILFAALLTVLAPVMAAQTSGGGTPIGQPGPKIKWYKGANNPVVGDVVPGTQRHPALQMTIERYPSATTSTTLARFGANVLGTLGVGYVDLIELWDDVNGDGIADSGDTLIGQSYDGNFIAPSLPPIQPGVTLNILVTVDVNAGAPLGQTLRVLAPRQPGTNWPFTFAFTPSETEFGELVTIGGFSFGGVLGGFQTVTPPPAPQLVVSDSTGAFGHAAAAAGDRDFGTVDVSAMPTAPATITLANTGNLDLNLGSVTISGSAAFVLDLSGFSATVAPGGSTSISISFDAAGVGACAATVEFTHDDVSQPSPFSFELAGIASSAATPVITTLALPDAMQGSAYGPVTVSAIGGTPAYTFTLASGALPAGLQLGATGEISGVADSVGIFSFTVRVTDAVGMNAEKPMSLTVTADSFGNSGSGGAEGGGCAAGAGLFAPWLLPLLLMRRRRK